MIGGGSRPDAEGVPKFVQEQFQDYTGQPVLITSVRRSLARLGLGKTRERRGLDIVFWPVDGKTVANRIDVAGFVQSCPAWLNCLSALNILNKMCRWIIEAHTSGRHRTERTLATLPGLSQKTGK